MHSIQSIRNLPPLEKGGVIARIGFGFQDHVAAKYCIQMIGNAEISEVWCETHDDITLIRVRDGCEDVEYVQVKDLQLGHFWSVAEICKREKDKLGSSILEKSFQNDRASEKSYFRLVSSLELSDELSILKVPFSAPSRSEQKIQQLATAIEQKLGTIKSPKGNDVCYWLKNLLWDVAQEEQIEKTNLLELAKRIQSEGFSIPIDQVETVIYPHLLDLVNTAGRTKWEVEPEKKHIKRADILVWLKEQADLLQYGVSGSSGKKLQEKMERVSIPNDYIYSALQERRRYRSERLNPNYLDLSEMDHIEGEIVNKLTGLRIKLDKGDIREGMDFFTACWEQLEQIHLAIPDRPPFYLLTGCMHDITDRCGHRYHKE